MSRHLTIATGATALFALAGRGIAFSSREGGIAVGPAPTTTPAPTPAAPATTTTITAAPKFPLLHAHIKAAADPATIPGPANLIKDKTNAKNEDKEDDKDDDDGDDDKAKDEKKGGDDDDNDGEDEIEEGETGACQTANQLINYCAEAIPNIESAPEDEIAQCLCCDADGSFEPEYFDDAASSCAGWIETAVPESTGAYSAWMTLATLCGSNNNGGLDSSVCSWSKTPATTKLAGPASVSSSKTSSGAASAITTTTTTPAAVVPEACDTLGMVGSYCLEETAGFDDLPLSSQAECLCYMSTAEGATTVTSWIPDYFDGAYSSCAGSTDTLSMDPGFANICSRAGDFLAVSVSATTTAAASSSSAVSAAAVVSATASQGGASETASGSATAVTVTVTPSAEPGTGAAAAGLSLPSTWPVAIGAMLGAAILLL